MQSAEHHIRVGDRGILTATAVAGGSGQRAGTARAHLHEVAAVHGCDAATAGSNGMDVDHSRANREADDLLLWGGLRQAIAYKADVAARATHIERNQIGEARLGADKSRACSPG